MAGSRQESRVRDPKGGKGPQEAGDAHRRKPPDGLRVCDAVSDGGHELGIADPKRRKRPEAEDVAVKRRS